MSNIILAGNIGFLKKSSSSVKFTDSESSGNSGTSPEIIEFQNDKNIALWGEDNRFPQNIINQMDGYGLGKEALNWKARMYFGGGIVPGKITGYTEGKGETFEPADLKTHKEIYAFIHAPWFHKFMIEYLQDLSWFINAFPEIILSNDGQKIKKFVHQESCDCRLEQYNKEGFSPNVFISKFWGASKEQIARFNPEKPVQGLKEKTTSMVNSLDKSLIKKVAAIDPYNPVDSLKKIASSLKSKNGLKSAILPVNFPSVGKTYYQLAAWDGSRLAGWIKIANKIPSLIQLMYEKAFMIKYHIEVPISYFHEKYGIAQWEEKTTEEKDDAKTELLESMDEFLTNEDGGFNSFVSFFGINQMNQNDFGRVKIAQIEDKSSLDKELVTGSAADQQFLISANINPTLFGAATIGTGQQRSGGSDIREAFLVYCAGLKLERQVMLAPLYLARDYNGWDPDIVFRIDDTVLTTLDTGAGTTKKLS